jgi:S1-C subfamily serine protease
VVRVNATDQAWDFFHPWTKHAPYSHRGLGAVLAHGEVLVTAELIENANYVELERAESGEKVPATVEAVDYEADLALLKPADDRVSQGDHAAAN